jgi:anti-sigma regulatory factor (Ser/Thr protein kinase)
VPGSEPHATILELRNRLEDLAALERGLARFAADCALPARELDTLNLVLDEIVTNLIEHAYDDDAEHAIRIRLALSDGELRVEVEDDGRPFDPLAAPPPELDAEARERRIGGLGLHFVRRSVDALEHRRVGGRNLLCLRKRIAGAGA